MANGTNSADPLGKAKSYSILKHSLYRTVFDALHSGILVVDAGTMRVVEFNKSFLSMSGRPARKLRHANLLESGLLGDSASSQKIVRRILKTRGEVSVPLIHGDGDVRETIVRREIINDAGNRYIHLQFDSVGTPGKTSEIRKFDEELSLPVKPVDKTPAADDHASRFQSFEILNRELSKQLADLRYAVDESTIVAVTDKEGIITFVNDRFCEISGFLRDEIVGNDHRILNSGYHPKSFFAELWQTISEGKVWHGEIQNRAKNGRLYWVNTTIVPLRDESGNIDQYIALRYDIGKRKAAERQRDDGRERMRMATEASGVGVWEWNIKTDQVRWDDQMFSIYGIEPTIDGFIQYGAWRKAVVPDDLPLQEAILQNTVRKKEKSRREFRILRNGEESPRHISAVETVRLDENGEVEWVVGTNIDITERKKAIRRLMVSETEFRSLVEATTQLVWRAGGDGAANTRVSWEKIVGIGPIPEPREWEDLVHPSDKARVSSEWQRCVAERCIFEAEFRLLHSDGTYHTFVSRGVPILEEQRVREWIGTITDVTAERRAVEHLRESEKRFRSLADTAPVFILIADSDKSFEYLNRTFLEFTGLELADARGKGWLKSLHPDDVDDFLAVYLKHFDAREDFEHQFRLRRNDAEFRWTFVRSVPRFSDHGGFLGFVATGIDITERVEAVERLRESEERFRQMAEGLPQLVWTCRGDDGYCDYLSPQWVAFTGIAEEVQHGSGWLEQVHPDDRKSTIERWQETVGKSLEFEFEFRIRRHDGVYRWFQTRAVPLRDGNGKIVKWFGTNTDIDDRRRTEDALVEAEKRFRATFEQAAVGIAHVALDGSWLYVNERLCQITGFSNSELLALSFHKISHPADVENDWELVRKLIRGELNTYTVEKRYVRKDRSLVWINLTVSMVRDSDRNPQYFITVIEDISRRKNAEKELRQWADAFENCAHGIAIANTDGGHILACNAAFAGLYGTSAKELQKIPMFTVFDRSLQNEAKEFFDESDKIGQVQFESMIRRSDGELMPAQMDVVSVRNEREELLYRVATLQDISARRNAAEALRASEGKLRLFVEYAPAAVAMLDRNLNYIAVSRRWMLDNGLEGDIVGRNHLDTFPDMPERWKETYGKCLEGEIYRAEEDQFYRADGLIGWLKWEGRPWIDAFGEVGGIMIFSEDVSDRKRRNANLAFLAEITEGLTKVRNVDEIVEFVGERCGDYFGATVCAYIEINEELLTADVFSEWRRDVKYSLVGHYNLREFVTDNFHALMKSGHAVIVSDVANDPRIADRSRIEKLGIGSFVNVPLFRSGKWRYAFGIYRERAQNWRDDEISLLLEAVTRIWNKLERARVEDALHTEQARFEKIAASSPSMICSFRLTASGKFHFPFVSPAVRQIFGVRPEELERRAVAVFRRLDREEMRRLNKSMERSILTLSLWNDSFRYDHPEKGEIWLEGFCTPILETDGSITWHGIVNDVTKRKEAEELLRESEKHYRLLFESNPLPMWVYDLQSLRFLAVNEAAVGHYGYSRKEFLKMKITDLSPAGDVANAFSLIETSREKRSKSKTFRHCRKDGSVIDVEIVSHGILFDGKVARFVLANDVTERSRAQAMILELNETLEQKVAERTSELNAVNRELESFSYSVSHDLRAPLRAMDGFSLALLEDYEDKLDDDGRNYLTRIRFASQKMARLIDDLLKLSRVSRGELNRTNVNLSKIVTSITEQLKEFQPTMSVEIEIENDLFVFADEHLMRVAFENLLGNSWKFTSKTENPKISFGKTVVNSEEVIFVRDNGAGFDMVYAAKLFGAFQRLHTSKEFEGTGIGLATVQRILNRHGGRVWAEGEVDKGAVFYLAVGSKKGE